MVNFEIGDKVALIHEKATGFVTHVHGNLIIVYVQEMEMDIEVDAKLLMLLEKKAPEIVSEPHKEEIPTQDKSLDKELEKLKEQGIGHEYNKAKTPKKKVTIPIEIDLHWEVLQKTNPVYTEVPVDAVDEIFRLQRLEFESFFLQALSNSVSAITIIHGIGSGKLREYIHAYLKRHVKEIDSYQVMNEGGVTQVIFKLT
jgi:dsDNA-specific endonuclease/ATPase MutS2